MAMDHAVGQQLLHGGLSPQYDILGCDARHLPHMLEHGRQGFHSGGEAV
jgi:hypothetical protein